MQANIIVRKQRHAGLMALVLPAILLSCKKFDATEANAFAPQRNAAMLAAVPLLFSASNLLYEETFESLGPYFYGGSLQVATSYGFKTITSPLYQGSRSGRFELRDTDPEVASGTRAEAKYPPITNTNRWYAYTMMLTAGSFKYDSEAEILSQWHQGGGTNPSISLITRYDKMYLEIRPDPSTKTQYYLGPIIKDTWQTLVFHIVHLHSSSGLVEIWQNGKQIFSKKGVNAYDYSKYEKPSFKIGIYKWEWNGTKTTDATKRVMYVDNIRMGNENATYSDMVKSASTNLNLPGTISSFTLVNAAPEQDVVKIYDGMTIDLSLLGVSKLNVRANPGIKFGSVRFTLTGPQSRQSKDNAAPYSLMGDDNNANYYYGSFDPPSVGEYTLTGMPYSGLDGTGLYGIPSTIHFTVVK